MSHFIHKNHLAGDTIAAIATPPGEGGVAIIRISGKDALNIADKVFSGNVLKFCSHTAHMGRIVDAEGLEIDSALCLVMHGPKSYTGENTVELQCHGGSLVTRRVLETVLLAGARMAEPGEFTLRAFLNGKIDLSQAEAVQEMIHAKNTLALSQARSQLAGSLSSSISLFQKRLVDVAAILEAWVDFPEEGLEFASIEEILHMLEEICSDLQKLQETFHDGKKISHGISLCLIGPPNAGKSSLMNALLKKDRAIVTPIAGTTRDLLEEDLTLGQFHFRLIDTAGVRKTEEIIEQEGISRSLQAMQDADLILLVLDSSITNPHYEFLKQCPTEKTLVIWNKVDLPKAPQSLDFPYQFHLSAKTKEGVLELSAAVEALLFKKGVPSKEEVVITKLRHFEAVSGALSSLNAVIDGLKTGISAEFVTADIKQALKELGTIIGTHITEDILSAIFSKFCVGK